MKKRAIDLLADYVFLSKYSQRKDGERGELETWEETIERIYSMHKTKLYSLHLWSGEVERAMDVAKDFEKRRMFLSSQRGRQFASPLPTSGILKHEAKLYNCCSTYIDRLEVFGEIMYLLLCGCGVGYSLHKEYIAKLPEVKTLGESGRYNIRFVVSDSIEGWGHCVNYLIRSLYEGLLPSIDFSLIRPEGALIDHKFAAPGPEPLKRACEKIIEIFMGVTEVRKLTSLEIHDIICHVASAVVSGGVRRSAMIALFDRDDVLMRDAKIGDWWTENPQRAMANNSILTSKEDRLTYDDYRFFLSRVKEYGEPGFVNVKDYSYTVNPCAEIVMKPVDEMGESGFAFCNLVEINAERISSAEEFWAVCRSASFIATVQSLYTDFKYLSPSSRRIAVRDRAVGVSITGLYANPHLRGQVLTRGARIVAQQNYLWASRFGINFSRSCTTVKPSGNASSILGLYCSGIHPAHAPQYLRRVRIKTHSPEFRALEGTPMVKVLRGDEAVISFPIDARGTEGVVFKDDVNFADHFKLISHVKHYWVNKGHVDSDVADKRHGERVPNNISATVEVGDGEWDEVAAVMYVNDYLFTGVSFLPRIGDQVYDNAPFQRLSTPEIKAEYQAIREYLDTHDIDFRVIMSERENICSGEMAAMGCSGGSCELR